jgi:hypothetical protein
VSFFFFTFCLLWLWRTCVSDFHGHAEEEDRRSGGKKKNTKWTSHVLCHASFLTKLLVCLATRIVAFLMKIADFTLMGPADGLAAVAQLLAATSMV